MRYLSPTVSCCLTHLLGLMLLGLAAPSKAETSSNVAEHDATGADISSPFDVGGRAQLFIDRLLVRDAQGVSFTLHQGKKHSANPLVVADQPWEGWRLEIFGSVLFDAEENIFKMWYIGESLEDFPHYATLYATSKDGITWEKPLFDIVQSQRGTKTNAVADGYILASVMKDPSDPDPQRRYKMIAWMQKPPHGAHLLVSPDGLHWTQISDHPICPSADVVTGFYDQARGAYVAFPKINSQVRGFDRRCFAVITSRDFETWTKPELVLKPDARDDAGSLARIDQVRPILDRSDDPNLMRTEFYGVGAYPAESCTIAFPWVLTVNANNRYGTNQEGPVEIQLAVSRDLKNWERPFRTPAIEIGQLDEWDASCHMTSAQAIRVGDEIRLYYSGGNYTHGTPVLFHDKHPEDGTSTGRKSKYTSSIGLVTWELDRFVSADGHADGGMLTTVPIVYEGNELQINARTKQDGTVEVEILDAAGRAIEGFGKSMPMSGDDLRHRVQWRHGASLAELRGKPVTLRFHLKDAELFSFAFRDAEKPAGP